jgi:hypothetical protein
MIQIQRLLFILTTLLFWTYSVATTVDKHLDQAKAVFEWVAGSDGGVVNNKLEVRRAIPGDVTSPLGVYATDRIEPNEVLIYVPWDIIIKSHRPKDDYGDQLPCRLVKRLAHELRLGNESKYAPYINYLNDEPPNQIPSSWTEGAQRLLRVVTDGIPFDWVQSSKRCREHLDVDDEFVTKAIFLILQRSDDGLMVGGYDFCNHRNGNWTNTKTEYEFFMYHRTISEKAIEAGQQIYLTYNMCAECHGRYYNYGTAGKFSHDS